MSFQSQISIKYNWKLGFSTFEGCGDAKKAEVMALLHDFSLWREMILVSHVGSNRQDLFDIVKSGIYPPSVTPFTPYIYVLIKGKENHN